MSRRACSTITCPRRSSVSRRCGSTAATIARGPGRPPRPMRAGRDVPRMASFAAAAVARRLRPRSRAPAGPTWRRPRDEDGTGAPHDLLGHAAHDQPVHPSPAMGPNTMRSTDSATPLPDRFARVALPDEAPDGDPLPASAIDDGLGSCLAVGADLVDPPAMPDTGQPLRPRVDDADQQDVTAETTGKVECEVLGARRGRCEISCRRRIVRIRRGRAGASRVTCRHDLQGRAGGWTGSASGPNRRGRLAGAGPERRPGCRLGRRLVDCRTCRPNRRPLDPDATGPQCRRARGPGRLHRATTEVLDLVVSSS